MSLMIQLKHICTSSIVEQVLTTYFVAIGGLVGWLDGSHKQYEGYMTTLQILLWTT